MVSLDNQIHHDNMEPLGEAVPVAELMTELSRVGILRKTNNSNNEVLK